MNWTEFDEKLTTESRSGPDPFRFNRAAQRFLDWLVDDGRYPLYFGSTFYVYDGTHYVEVENLPQMIRTFFKKAGLPQSNHVIGNVAPIVENFAYRAAHEYGPMPFYVGNDPKFPAHRNIIAYRNGLMDLETYRAGDRTLLAHTSKWISTFCLPYRFDPEAECPTWLAFLGDVFEGDQERIDLLQEWFGYCLTPDISQHKALVKLGPPRAGKGTTDAVLRAVVGDDHTTGFNLHYLADKFGPRRLEGKLVAFVGEVNLANSREKYRILETWNSIVGGDPVPIERKNRDESPSLVLPTRFSISCNEMPSFVDPTGALTARLLILNYDRSFLGKEDRALTDKLLAEIVGISNWALEGYCRLKANGRFTEPKAMTGLLNGFRRENSHLFAFMQDCLKVNNSLDPGNLDGVGLTEEPVEVNSAELEQVYKSWCLSHSFEPNFAWMGRSLRALLPKLLTKRKRVSVTNELTDEAEFRWAMTYSGIGLAL
jgi:P4 family phage/plasmid primase-like protien